MISRSDSFWDITRNAAAFAVRQYFWPITFSFSSLAPIIEDLFVAAVWKISRKHVGNRVVYMVPVETLSPEPFVLKRPLHVEVLESDEDAVATFANLGMSGHNGEDAVRNLKAVIVDTFDQFEANESILGPEPKRQLAVLREFIQRRAERTLQQP